MSSSMFPNLDLKSILSGHAKIGTRQDVHVLAKTTSIVVLVNKHCATDVRKLLGRTASVGPTTTKNPSIHEGAGGARDN